MEISDQPPSPQETSSSTMEPINALNSSYISSMTLWIIFPDPSIEVLIKKVFDKFQSNKEPGLLLQFWACYISSTPPKSKDTGFNLKLIDQPFVSTPDHQGLEDYRRSCLEIKEDDRFVGLKTGVGNWFAGRAAQTRIADQRTEDFVGSQDSDFAKDKGQLVLPVFSSKEELIGIIELVTIVRKKSYSEDFDQLCQLLKDEGLRSSYMGRMIKVRKDKDKDHWIKFPLPYSAKLADLRREVSERFQELGQTNFPIYHEDNDDGDPISSDVDLQRVMAKSCSRGEKAVKMRVCVNSHKKRRHISSEADTN